ncbi:MAG: hypothetical protein QXE51_00305 [Nitrososphaeria archaeon]
MDRRLNVNEIIAIILFENPEGVPVQDLTKLVFEIEYAFYKETSTRLTDVNYYQNDSGANSPEIASALSSDDMFEIINSVVFLKDRTKAFQFIRSLIDVIGFEGLAKIKAISSSYKQKSLQFHYDPSMFNRANVVASDVSIESHNNEDVKTDQFESQGYVGSEQINEENGDSSRDEEEIVEDEKEKLVKETIQEVRNGIKELLSSEKEEKTEEKYEPVLQDISEEVVDEESPEISEIPVPVVARFAFGNLILRVLGNALDCESLASIIEEECNVDTIVDGNSILIYMHNVPYDFFYKLQEIFTKNRYSFKKWFV